VARVGSMWTLFFGPAPVRRWADAAACDTARFARFFQGMLGRGVLLAPSQFEANFISTAHTEADIARTADAAGQVLGELGD
jgi:glutamate-1-semialdehyde 2,1-aminomutase